MSQLLERVSLPDRQSTDGPSPVPAGLFAAGQAIAASLAAILGPVVLAWAVASSAHVPWTSAVRVGLIAWLLAHHAGIAVPGGHIGLVPLGLLAIPLLTCWFGGVRLARRLDPHAAQIRDGVGRAAPSAPPARAVLAMVSAYAAFAGLTSALTATADARPLAAQAVFGAGIVCGVGAVTGAAAWRGGGRRAGLRLLAERALPETVRRWLPGAGVVLAVQLGAGLILLVVAAVAGWSREAMLNDALAPGVTGTGVLTLAQLGALPNAVIWAASFAAGPGFAFGVGTSVTPGGTVLGALPALPMLGALPVPGAHPGWWWLVLAVPLLAGAAVVGWQVFKWREPPLRDLTLEACASTLLAGVVFAGLAWLSGGPVGPGRLSRSGPVPWQAGVALGGLALAGALLAVAVLALTRQVRGRQSSPGSNPG